MLGEKLMLELFPQLGSGWRESSPTFLLKFFNENNYLALSFTKSTKT